MSLSLRAGIVGTGFMGGVHSDAVRAAGHVVRLLAGSSPAAVAVPVARPGSPADVQRATGRGGTDVIRPDRSAPDGLPTFADGLRAAVASRQWVEVSAA